MEFCQQPNCVLILNDVKKRAGDTSGVDFRSSGVLAKASHFCDVIHVLSDITSNCLGLCLYLVLKPVVTTSNVSTIMKLIVVPTTGLCNSQKNIFYLAKGYMRDNR